MPGGRAPTLQTFAWCACEQVKVPQAALAAGAPTCPAFQLLLSTVRAFTIDAVGENWEYIRVSFIEAWGLRAAQVRHRLPLSSSASHRLGSALVPERLQKRGVHASLLRRGGKAGRASLRDAVTPHECMALPQRRHDVRCVTVRCRRRVWSRGMAVRLARTPAGAVPP